MLKISFGKSGHDKIRIVTIFFFAEKQTINNTLYKKSLYFQAKFVNCRHGGYNQKKLIEIVL